MPITDLTKVAAFQEECIKLWESGNISHRTMLEAHGIDIDMEYERMKKERDNGYNDVFIKPGTSNSENNDNTDENARVGRPAMDDSERESDPGKAVTGRQPKPSSEEGSEEQEV